MSSLLTTALKQLSDNPQLTTLTLASGSMDDAGAEQLAEALKVNKTITLLDLGDTSFTDRGALALGVILQTKHNIIALNMVGNNSISPATNEFLTATLKHNQKITAAWAKIWLSANHYPKAMEIANNLAKHAPQEAILLYNLILAQDPTKWDLYKSLATLYQQTAQKAHICSRAASQALAKEEYKIAEEFAKEAYKLYPDPFVDRLILLEIYRRQNQHDLIRKTLLDLIQIYEKKSLFHQQLKASKMLAQLDPNANTYEEVITLYTQIGKTQKALQWMTNLSKLVRQREEKDAPAAAAAAAAPKRAALPDIAFGKALWEKYFGDVGDEPPLPADIDKILENLCPYVSCKKVRETHLLVLIPKSVNGKPLTLNRIEEVVKNPKGGGHATQYRYFWDTAMKEHGDTPAPASHWILMTRDVIEGSRNKTFDQQKALVKAPYAVPSVLEATVAIFLEYVHSGTRLYSDKPYTYTFCQEKISGYQLVVGGFAPAGLFVYYYVGVHDSALLGVGGSLVFES